MCFTIEGNSNGLIIIDGGYSNNDEQIKTLREKNAEHGNVVDAWIITHFDSDHAGVFVKLKSDDNNIKINKVFVPNVPVDMDLLKENAPFENEWQTYEEYLKLNVSNLIQVHPGDKYENLIGLNMKVLSSYEDWIDEKMDNLFNNGSIVFKLEGKEESALFCGDVESEIIGEYLIDNYKEELKAEYLQIAHHGNNNLSDEFYRLVNPKIVFFCAPDWLINNDNGIAWFTVQEHKDFLEKMGCKILWYNTSPNKVEMK